MKEVKNRRIRKEDWTKIEIFVNDELEKRKSSQYRKDHERVWAEVDRQLRMEPMQRVTPEGQKVEPGWNAVFELGELSKVSEVIAADVRRIIFPMDRGWFDAHIEIPPKTTAKGPVKADASQQKRIDGTLRSFMVQQHMDFGFKARFDGSIKEALHHGSFVAEAEWRQEMMVAEGSKIATIGAPAWVAHSMWNCYPDESPAVGITSMFYTGSMIIRRFLPLYKLKQMEGEGWMPAQYSKIKKTNNNDGGIETEDIELIYYYGDVNIERQDGDIYLPNSKVICANGTLVYYAPTELPYPPIIFGGYEKQDTRDPYYTSPLIKQSPIQKIATILANKFVDGVALRTEPPIVYDGNDPYFVQTDGPVIAPGAKTGTKGSTDFKSIEVGDPRFALEGLQMCLRQLQEGTGVNAVRTGVPNSDRQTATEVNAIAQGAEVRTIDFIDKLNANLRSWLYMQHELNKKYCDRYSFYNAELGSADFIRITKKDIPANVHFEIVGSKGILGEEQRASRTAQVVAFASGNPLFAPLLKPADILQEMFQDAGNKNPERFVQLEKPKIPPEVQQQIQMQMQQAQQAMQQMQTEMQKLQDKLRDKSADDQARQVAAAQELKTKQAEAQLEMKVQADKAQQQLQINDALAKQKLQHEHQAHLAEMTQEKYSFVQEMQQKHREFVQEMKEQAMALHMERRKEMEQERAERAKPKKSKIKRTADGYEVHIDGEAPALIKKTGDGFDIGPTLQ